MKRMIVLQSTAVIGSWCFLVVAGTVLPTLAAQLVITTIDNFGTAQSLTFSDSAGSSTVAAAGAIGGFRTMDLSSTGGDGVSSTLAVSTKYSPYRLNLSTPTDVTSAFTIKWAGSGGTAGLGGVDLKGGNPAPLSLNDSTLNFSLRSADLPSTFTWAITDTGNHTALFSGTFPTHLSTSPLLQYAISFSSFANAASVDWSAVNSIAFSGGGLELDLSLVAPIEFKSVMVPESGALPVACALLVGTVWFRMTRRASRPWTAG